MRRLIPPVALAAAVAVAPLLVAAPARAAVVARRVATGLNYPAAFTFGPNDRIWYGEKNTGEIRVINAGTGADHRFFLVGRVDGTSERGLLGIALHPDFPRTPDVYVYVTRAKNGRLRNQILRIRDRHGHGRNPEVVFSSPASGSPYHNGGRILFGPDGMLYAIVGEGHSPANAQQLGNDQGKILRMTPAGGIPDDNPLGHRRIFAYGIRNSFGFDFDPRTGDLWETENGPDCNDELNRIRPGRNYGWGPSYSCGSATPPLDTNKDGPNPVLPLRWYTPTIAPTGMAFCEGCGLGRAAEGAFFFGAHNTGDIARVQLNAARDDILRRRRIFHQPSGVLSIEAGPGGALYFSDSGAIYRLARG
jgi:glucose/arabinose dehydrogenase